MSIQSTRQPFLGAAGYARTPPVPANPATTVPANIPVATTAETPNSELLSARLADSFALSGNAPATLNQDAIALADALAGLQQVTGSGPDSSLISNLQRFTTETLPQKINSLNQQITNLETQLESASPEARIDLQNQLQATRELLDLYQQAGQALQASPLLAAPIQAAPLFDVTASIEAAIIPLETAKTSEARSNYNAQVYDEFLTNPRSEATIFNQRRLAIDDQITQLDQAIASLGADQPDELAKSQELKTLLQSLSGLYGSIQDLTQTGPRAQADVSTLADRIETVTQALNTVKSDLEPDAYQAIQSQVQDFTTIATEYLTMPVRPGNLGYTIDITYKRRGEIQAGKRTRESGDITGALKSYINDQSDMAVFVQRFGDLRSDIRSGKLRGQAAIDKALAGIPGTSAEFRAVFTKLIKAELALTEAQRLQESAAAANARGNDNAATGESNLAEARAATAEGREANRGARSSSARGDYGQAGQQNQRARERQQDAEGSLGSARANANDGRSQAGIARQKLADSDAQIALARNNADAANRSAYRTDLSKAINGVRGQASQLEAGNQAISASTSALISRLGGLDTGIADASADNQALSNEITETDQSIESGLEAQTLSEQQATQNSEIIPVDLNMANFGPYIDRLNSEGDSIKLVISADGSIGPGILALRGQGEISISITMLDNGKYAVKFSGEGQLGGQIRAGAAANLSLSAGLNGALTYTFTSPQQLSDFLIDSVRDTLGSSLANQVFPNLEDAPDMDHIRPSTQTGQFFELKGEVSFGGLKVNGATRASRTRTVGSTGRVGLRESIMGTLGFNLGNIKVSGSVERFSVSNNSTPENNGQYLSTSANVSYNLTPQLKKTLRTDQAEGRRQVIEQLENVGVKLGLSGAGLSRFVRMGADEIQSASRSSKTNISFSVSAQWSVNTRAANLSDAPRAPIGRLSSVNVGVGVSRTETASVNARIASVETSASLSATDNRLFVQDTIAAQGMYFGTPESRARLLSNGQDYALTGSNDQASTLGAEVRRYQAMERYADANSGGDSGERERLMYEQRTQGRVFE